MVVVEVEWVLFFEGVILSVGDEEFNRVLVDCCEDEKWEEVIVVWDVK